MQQRTDRIKSLATVSQFRVGALLVQPERLLVVVEDREISLEPRLMEVLVKQCQPHPGRPPAVARRGGRQRTLTSGGSEYSPESNSRDGL